MKRAHQISAVKGMPTRMSVGVGCAVTGVLAEPLTASGTQAATIQIITALTTDSQIT